MLKELENNEEDGRVHGLSRLRGEEARVRCRGAPAPSMMAQVAPHEAPDEMPKIYGSAKVF